ncbi:MAG: hypothetical protein AAFP28_09440 [Pseudomonadota bacterium]
MAALTAPSLSAAQEVAAEPEAPLSAIEWLEQVPVEEGLGAEGTALLLETPVVNTGAIPSVEAAPLDQSTGPGIGLFGEAASGFPSTLWQGADLAAVDRALAALPDEALAPVAALRMRLLLASAAAPRGTVGSEFLEMRVGVLTELGAADEALALLEGTDPMSPEVFTAYADLALISNTEDVACRRLALNPALSDDLAFRVFCLARNRDWNAAALTLQSGEILGDIPGDLGALLAQFLEPELAEQGPPKLDDIPTTPLVVRLREAVGVPLATAGLPRVYAQGDLRPEMGWKAQIDAAERLVRTGALRPGQLFALYTEGTPSASGSVWERAEAVQKLDAALDGGSARALERALDAAWNEMALASLLEPLAVMVAPQLDPSVELSAKARAQLNGLLLLSDRYENAGSDAGPLALGLAYGDVSGAAPSTALERALVSGFSGQPTRPTGTLGVAILQALAQVEAARQGDLSRLGQGLSTLRAVGLESSARQIALHLLVLS